MDIAPSEDEKEKRKECWRRGMQMYDFMSVSLTEFSFTLISPLAASTSNNRIKESEVLPFIRIAKAFSLPFLSLSLSCILIVINDEGVADLHLRNWFTLRLTDWWGLDSFNSVFLQMHCQEKGRERMHWSKYYDNWNIATLLPVYIQTQVYIALRVLTFYFDSKLCDFAEREKQSKWTTVHKASSASRQLPSVRLQA